ncbi:TPA: hypothetical protein ACH73J_005182, partial [Escherichia coli]
LNAWWRNVLSTALCINQQLPFSGGALFGYDEYSHIVSDLSTQYVNNVVFGFLMDKKSPR